MVRADPRLGGRGGSVPGVFERFTDRARRVLVLAQDEARLLDHTFIGTEHLLLGLLREEDGVAAQVLHQLGVRIVPARELVREAVGALGEPGSGPPPFTPRAKKVLELSLREAFELGHHRIGTEHLLLGLVREGKGVAAQVLVKAGADLAAVRERVMQAVSPSPSPSTSTGRAPADPPLCQRCRSPLAETAAYQVLEVASPDGSGAPIQVTVVYCQACGCALGQGPVSGV